MAFSIAMRGKRLKKFYCIHCEERLKREKITRTVTSQDEDYGEHLPRGAHPGKRSGASLSFHYTYVPKQKIKVSDTRFACPVCHKRVAFDEQMIRARIQKNLKKRRLSPTELVSHREEAARKQRNAAEAKGLFFSLGVLAICGVIYYFCAFNPIPLVIIGIWMLVKNIFRSVMHRNDPISESRDDEMHRLHARAYGNREELQSASLCHCFCCVKSFSPAEIGEWAEDGKTAVCPYCHGTTVIPENETDPIDDSRLARINQYWY